MRHPDIKETFAPGSLTDAWQNVLVFTKRFPSEERTKKVEDLQQELIKWTRCKPWPPENPDNYTPESFEICVWPKQAADFYYLFGAGDATSAFLSDEEYEGLMEPVDIEAEIVKHCLDYLRERMAQHKVHMQQVAGRLVDYLAAHVGEQPTREEMVGITGGTADEIAAVIDRLSDGNALVIDHRQIIRSIDVAAAKQIVNDKTER